MKRTHSTILMVALGLVILIVVVGAGTAAWFYLSVFDSVDADETLAQQSFAEARARFPGQQPIIALKDDRIELVRKAPDAPAGRDLRNVHALTWNAEEGTLTRMVLPFWLVRMKNSAVDVAFSSDGMPISLTVEEIERYGPALFLDHMEEDGSRALVWTD